MGRSLFSGCCVCGPTAPRRPTNPGGRFPRSRARLSTAGRGEKKINHRDTEGTEKTKDREREKRGNKRQTGENEQSILRNAGEMRSWHGILALRRHFAIVS